MSYEARRPACGRHPESALRVAEYFLHRRQFDDCKKYALQAQQSHPNLPGLPQILAVANVLLAAQTRISETQPDYYSILNLKPFSQDTNLLKEKFLTLITTLTPSKNRYPFADEALELVRNAWYVLSNPLRKTEFDSLITNGYDNGNEEKVEESCGNSENMDTFWTVCPYCNYVYEFAKVYEDCCLRCWNEKFGRGFHGFAINAPPANVLRDGKFLCSGFNPFGFDLGKGNSGCSSWTPFVPKKNDGNEGGNVDNADNVRGWDNFVEISDDDEDSSCGGHKFEESCKEMETGKMNVEFDESSKEMETGETNVWPTISKPDTKRMKKSVGKNTTKFTGMKRVKKSVGKNTTKLAGTGFRYRKQDVVDQSGEGLVTKRMKKSVGKNTKKLAGTGFRVRKQDVVDQSAEELDMHMEASIGEEDMRSGFWGGMEMEGGDELVMGEIEFFNGEDDIFVSFDGI